LRRPDQGVGRGAQRAPRRPPHWVWVRFGRGKRFGFFGFGVDGGFVWETVAEGAETLEFLDGAAVKTLGLRLVAEEQRPAVGLGGQEVEATGQRVVVVLAGSDFDALGKLGVGEDWGSAGAFQGPIEAIGEESAFEGGDAEERLLGERDALDGKEFLGVDGLIKGDEVGREVGDGVEIFDADDGEVAGRETVLPGVLSGTGFAFWSARAGGMSGVFAIGGEAFGGNGLAGTGHECQSPFALSFSMRGGGSCGLGRRGD